MNGKLNKPGEGEWVLHSEEATLQQAADWIPYCHAPAWVWLLGPLGAGKTTWVRGMLRAMGHQGVVKSPSYSLLEAYALDSGIVLLHMDLYRLEGNLEELGDWGLYEYPLERAIVCVEWPQHASGSLPTPDWSIRFEDKGQARAIRIVRGVLCA